MNNKQDKSLSKQSMYILQEKLMDWENVICDMWGKTQHGFLRFPPKQSVKGVIFFFMSLKKSKT